MRIIGSKFSNDFFIKISIKLDKRIFYVWQSSNNQRYLSHLSLNISCQQFYVIFRKNESQIKYFVCIKLWSTFKLNLLPSIRIWVLQYNVIMMDVYSDMEFYITIYKLSTFYSWIIFEFCIRKHTHTYIYNVTYVVCILM